MRRQTGFTLIEMVAVIIILSIMAAVALPRFTNLGARARLSALNGLAGGMRSAVVLAKSTWLAENSGLLNTIEMHGTLVSVQTVITAPVSTALWGTPLINDAGIALALDNPTGFTSGYFAWQGTSGVAFWPTGVAVSERCAAFYSSETALVTLSASTVSAVACA